MIDFMQEWEAELTHEDMTMAFIEISDAIGIPATVALSKRLGGIAVYIPKTDNLKKAVMKRRIVRARADGGEYREIAKQYQCTEVFVRELCDEATRAKNRERKNGIH
jgi:Mor family transcriptional regulator